jgi:hypothetical protein
MAQLFEIAPRLILEILHLGGYFSWDLTYHLAMTNIAMERSTIFNR